jgi:hypothetical protein
MNATKLFTDNIVEHETITDTHTYLEEYGFPVDVEATYLVCSDSGKGYIVQEITTTKVPLMDADVAEDQVTMFACTCHSWRYHDGVVDLEEADELEWSRCKHGELVVNGPAEKHKKAARDDNQRELDQ